MSEAAAESNPSYLPSLPSYSWGAGEQTESIPPSLYDDGKTNHQQVRIVSNNINQGGQTSLLWVSGGKFQA